MYSINMTTILICQLVNQSVSSFNYTEDIYYVIASASPDLNNVLTCNFPWIHHWTAIPEKYSGYKIRDKQPAGQGFADNQIAFGNGRAKGDRAD